MGSSNKIRRILKDKGLTQAQFAEMIGKDYQQTKNALSRDYMNYRAVEKWLNALDCEIVFRDKKTGKLYD